MLVQLFISLSWQKWSIPVGISCKTALCHVCFFAPFLALRIYGAVMAPPSYYSQSETFSVRVFPCPKMLKTLWLPYFRNSQIFFHIRLRWTGGFCLARRYSLCNLTVRQDVVNVASSSRVVTVSGEVYTWGDNDEGQLGDGTTSAIQKPRLVAALQGCYWISYITVC